MYIKLYLKPSMVAEYYNYECDRFLFTECCSVVTDDTHVTEAESDISYNHSASKSDLNPVERAGIEWENSVYEELAARCESMETASFMDAREMSMVEWMDVIDNQIGLCNQDQKDICLYIAQPQMYVNLGNGSRYREIVTEWSKAVPDLLFVNITYNSEIQCAEACISVLDVKLSSIVKLNHKLQICIYSKMLEKVFSEKDNISVNMESGYVINKPHSVYSDSVIKNLEEGEIGNRIMLKGAGIIIDDFISNKIPEAEDCLYAAFKEKFERGIRAGDVDEFIKKSQYIVCPECKKCVNYSRCISLKKWNEESILFLPYLSKSAQRKLWELAGEYSNCIHLSRFKQLVYGENEIKRDAYFCELLRENSDWNKCLYNDQAFKKSVDLLETTYYQIRRNNGSIRREGPYADYLRKNGFSYVLPRANDISVYVYAEEEYVENAERNVEKKIKLAFLAHGAGMDSCYKEYEYSSTEARAGLAFFEDLLTELDRRKAFNGNADAHRTISFFAFQDHVCSIITKSAYELYRASILEDDDDLYACITRFLNYIQDENTLTKRNNHPEVYYKSALISLITEIDQIFILPGMIEYSVNDIVAFFTGEKGEAPSVREYLNRLHNVVCTIGEAAQDHIWGIASDYDNEETFDMSETDYERSVLSKLYYESMYEDALSDESILKKYFNDISDYRFFEAYYDPDDENTVLVDKDDHVIEDMEEEDLSNQKRWTRLKIVDGNNGNKYKVLSMMEDIRDAGAKKIYMIETDNINEAFEGFLHTAVYDSENKLLMKRSIDFPDYIMVNTDVSGNTDRKFYIAASYNRDGHYTSKKIRSMTYKLQQILVEEPEGDMADHVKRIMNPSVQRANDLLSAEGSMDHILELGNIEDDHGQITTFTESQAEALRHICEYHDTIIQGPPGTGKTDFIARSVIAVYRFLSARRREEEPVRILLTSNSHAAIINIINKIYEMTTDDELRDIRNALYKVLLNKSISDADVRLRLDEDHLLYEKAKTTDNVRRYELHIKANDVKFEPDNSPIIIGLTPWKCYDHGSLWSGGNLPEFDMVIIDESSQVSLSAAFMAVGLRKAEGRTVIVGDDDQLSAIVQGNYIVENHAVDVYHSVLDYYRYYYLKNHPDENMVCMLSENFRMNEVLLGYSAQKIYGPRYTSFHDGIAGQKLRLGPQDDPEENIDHIVNLIMDEDYPLVVCYLKGRRTHEQIAIEKYLIRKLSMSLYNRMRYPDGDRLVPYRPLVKFFGGQDDNITPALGIVVPHNSYKDNLRYVLKEDFKDLANERGEGETDEDYERRILDTILVGTVDKLQGQEREAIIVSYGIADVDQINKEAEFIYSRNRLNVAITRAKKKMIVILPDNFAEYTLEILMKSNNKLEEGIDFVAGLREYMRTADHNSGNTSVSENMEIIMPYREDNMEREYRGRISIYRKQ